jgi:dTDP-4-amino-4,6-dideoxygalactose transaminase
MHRRPSNEIWNYQQIELGFNYRMTDIQAALGLSQMNRLDEFVRRRHEIAMRYGKALKELPIVIPLQKKENYSSYHLYPIRVPMNDFMITQQQVCDRLFNNGIAPNLHYIPVHRQPFFEGFGFKPGDFPEAENFHKEAISIPIYPSLSTEEQAKVSKCLVDTFKENIK